MNLNITYNFKNLYDYIVDNITNIEEYSKNDPTYSTKEAYKKFFSHIFPSQEGLLNTFNTLSAKLARDTKLKKTDKNLYDARSIIDTINTDSELHIFKLLFTTITPEISIPRASFLEKQNTRQSSRFSIYVPVLLAAFKEYNNVQYKEWDRLILEKFKDDLFFPDTAAFMFYDAKVDLTKEKILEGREQIIESAKKGRRGYSIPAPKSIAIPYPNKENPLYKFKGDKAGDMLILALCQLWCHDLEIRSKYAISSPSDWDFIPSALIDVEVLKTKYCSMMESEEFREKYFRKEDLEANKLIPKIKGSND